MRFQKTTVFAFGEGEAEGVFLKHLRSIYANNKTSVKIDSAGGKGVSFIINKATRVRGNIPYNHSFVLLDSDGGSTEAAAKKAERKGIELIFNNPCLETLLLSILEPEKKHVHIGSTSANCKKYFEATHIGSSRTILPKDCQRLFSRGVLDQQKDALSVLKRIVDIMEGNF